MLIWYEEFVQIQERAPSRLPPEVFIPMFIRRNLPRSFRPFGQCHRPIVHVWLQHLAKMVGGIVVIQVEMLHPHQRMILNPLLQIRCLVLENGTQRQAKFRIPRLSGEEFENQLVNQA